MRYLDFTPQGLMCFGMAFIAASLVALAVYWTSRSRNRWVQRFCALFAGIAVLGAGLVFLATIGYTAVLYSVFYLGLVLALGAIQATFERAHGREALNWGHQFGRALLCYVSAAFIGTFFMGYGMVALFTYLFPTLRPSSRPITMGSFGYLAGVILAPLAISFFRWVFASLPLRPGVDRPLETGEAEHDQEVAQESQTR